MTASRAVILWLSLGLLLASALPWNSLRAAPVENKLVMNARKVTVPYYAGPENRLSLNFKADRFTKESQRKGFFRIGVLPLLVVHDANLEVRRPEYFNPAVRQFHQYVAGKDLKKTVELRGFTLTVPTNGITLTATKVRILSPEQWELSGSVRLIDRTGTHEFSKALLAVSGNETGMLRANTGASHSLFKPYIAP
jgi:hypothetical protein